MVFSKQFTLNLNDFQRGLVMTVGGAIFGIVWPIVEKWLTEPGWLLPQINWALIFKTAMSAGLVYLFKNWVTPTPKTITIDATKTTVIDKETSQPVVDHTKVEATVVTTDEPIPVVDEGK